MFERVKRFFGLSKASQPTVQPPFQYQQNKLYGQLPGLPYSDTTRSLALWIRDYVALTLQTAPWMYPMYPGMPNTVPNQGGHWVPPVPPPGLPSGQFPAVYHPPPYPPPQMYPAPPMANPQASGQTPSISYGLPAALLAP
ncbi:hypothetical protein B0H13DRAFT_1904979 [Mycena leptocephala]|nr:hypothetical protein B0H13DRAFT_1904979 [Mycena leptocephala]